jgi:hypothetical protein
MPDVKKSLFFLSPPIMLVSRYGWESLVFITSGQYYAMEGVQPVHDPMCELFPTEVSVL